MLDFLLEYFFHRDIGHCMIMMYYVMDDMNMLKVHNHNEPK
jgi:hypothetical protein